MAQQNSSQFTNLLKNLQSYNSNNSSSTVVALASTLGAAGGAAVGSTMGPMGTLLGGAVGGIVGTAVGKGTEWLLGWGDNKTDIQSKKNEALSSSLPHITNIYANNVNLNLGPKQGAVKDHLVDKKEIFNYQSPIPSMEKSMLSAATLSYNTSFEASTPSQTTFNLTR